MIFLACFLTLVIEVPFLALFGYRGKYALTVTVCTNVLTNLLLNLIIQLVFHGDPGFWILFMELAVIYSEFGIYCAAFGPSAKLHVLTFAANALSYGIGLLIFR